MKTPADKTITFTYYSHPVREGARRWKARLTFAPGSTDESDALLEIVDGFGAPLAAGKLELGGARIMIRDGRGTVKCGDFIKGIHGPGIWLHRKGRRPVPGALTFE